MADVQYNDGVADEAPQTQAPNDLQNIQPRAAAGLVQLGQGAAKAASFYQDAAANDQFNDFLTSAGKLMYGDASKTTTGPDGQPIADTGFMGMKGADAMRARPKLQTDLDALMKTTRDNLSTPQEQEQFDTYSRRYRISLDEQIGSHSDQQQTAWYGQVNTDSAQNALNLIYANPDDPKNVAAANANLINARLKQATLDGASPGDPVYRATYDKARQEGATALIDATGAKDPAKALRMIDSYRQILGDQYAPLSAKFQEKGDRQDGQDFVTAHNAQAAAEGTAVNPYTNPQSPEVQQAVASVPGGFSPAGLARTAAIESGGDPNAGNASDHMGLTAFSKAAWATYGAGGDRMNPQDSLAAAQRMAVANGKYLQSRFGRPATDAELYLAHQQGPEGSYLLLSNPNANAAALVGRNAIIGNHGTADMTAAQYVAMWTHRFNGTIPSEPGAVTPPAQPRVNLGVPQAAGVGVPQTQGPAGQEAPALPDAPAAPQGVQVQAGNDNQPAATAQGGGVGAAQSTGGPLSDVYKAIQASDLNDQAKQYAFQEAERQQREQAIADSADTSARTLRNADAMNTYTSSILLGKYPSIATIANDPNLTAEGKDAMQNMMLRHADDSQAGALYSYGPGYFSAMNQILAQPGDPSRVTDPVEIYKRSGPGGDLTPAGAMKLVSMQKDVTKTDAAAEQTTFSSLLSYAKNKLSFQQEPSFPGDPGIKDPQGEMLFNARLLPRAEKAFSDWKSSGKDPFEFLTQDNFDKMAQGLRSPQEMALAKIEAIQKIDTSGAMIPAPQGTDQQGWNEVLSVPMTSKSGRVWSPGMWANAVYALQQNPTPEIKKQFNDFFPNSPIGADDILSILRPPGMTDDQAKAARQSEIGGYKGEEVAPPRAPEIYNPIPALAPGAPRGR